MTQPFDDEYGERLRRALHAEAEAVTPSPEGLERIRTKISKRRERRLGYFISAPWLRPLAAVAAALFVCVITVSATPALKNFVQTGHFSPDSGNGDGNSSTTGKTHGQMPPGYPTTPLPSTSPSPTSIHSPNTGKHVVTCPPGYGVPTPTSTPAPPASTAPPSATVACQPESGNGTPQPPITDAPTPPSTTSPAEPPSDQPTSDVAPAPNQSP
jgi:hypothetical protein